MLASGLTANDTGTVLLGTLLLLSAVAPWIARRRFATPFIYGACALIAAALAVAAGVAGLATIEAPLPLVDLPVGLPMARTLLGWDQLSSIFATLINTVIAVVSVYAIGYGHHEQEPQRVLPFYPAFLAGMNLVLLANDAFAFLLGWEFMSVTSWALVVSQHRERGNQQAGLVYLVMALGGTLTLLMFFGVLAGHAGSYGFAAIRQIALPGLTGTAVLLLGLLGTGSKAGLFPLHAWLPLAHPAAPSHVSALMSGVMTKVAIYGFVRFAFDLVPPGEAGDLCGGFLVALGAITAVYGVLAALFETDLKRVLAYSTIENIGLIFGALGLALAFQAEDFHAAAALALTTALLHTVNHAWIKSLLFMGAGALVHATGSRDLDTCGGLITRMPRTATVMLIGCAAIAALPPLNGFVSEWLLFQAVLASPTLPGWLLKMIIPAAGAAFALTAALAAAAFVRVFGFAFLGRPRSDHAAQARETDRYATSAMLVAAVVCVALGALPVLAIEPLQHLVGLFTGTRMPIIGSAPWLSLMPLASSRSTYNGLIVLVFLLSAGSIAALVLRLVASGALRRSPAWDCGFPDPRPVTQYTATSFAQPLQRVFGRTLFLAREQVDMPPPGDPRSAVAEVSWRDLPWEFAYQPVGRGVLWVAGKMNALQFLTIRRYLLLVFSALLTLLAVVAAWH